MLSNFTKNGTSTCIMNKFWYPIATKVYRLYPLYKRYFGIVFFLIKTEFLLDNHRLFFLLILLFWNKVLICIKDQILGVIDFLLIISRRPPVPSVVALPNTFEFCYFVWGVGGRGLWRRSSATDYWAPTSFFFLQKDFQDIKRHWNIKKYDI